MKSLNAVIVLCFISILGGCTSNAARVPDAKGLESSSALWMGCSTPVELTQDCSLVSLHLGTKQLEINGVEIYVAGNSDGRMTLLQGSDILFPTRDTNLAYEIIKRELVSEGHEIVNLIPLEELDEMHAYIIETAHPSYHLWDKFENE